MGERQSRCLQLPRQTWDIIQVLLDHEPHDFTITPENIPLNIVYEDDDLLVVNKPAGLVVHPGHGNYEHTLLHALAWHFEEELKTKNEKLKLDINNPDIGLVHRIDKDTSGLLLIAKTWKRKRIWLGSSSTIRPSAPIMPSYGVLSKRIAAP